MNIDKLFPFLGIRGKLLVVFVVVGIGPLGIVGVYTVHSMTEALVASHADHLRAQLDTSVGHIERYVTLIEANIAVIAQSVEGVGTVCQGNEMTADARQRAEEFFHEVARMRPDYYQLRLLSQRGRERVRINRYSDRLARVPERDLQDKSDRYYFGEAMAVGERTYISAMDLNVERGEVERPHQLVFRVGRRICAARGQTPSLVLINVFAHEILDKLKPLRARQEGEVLLVDARGRFVRENCGREQCSYELGEIRSYLTDFSTGDVDALVVGGTAAMAQGQTRLMSYAPIRVGGAAADRGWRLAIVHATERVLAPIHRMKRQYYLFGALVAVFAFVLTALATRALVRPIRRILGFVEGIAAGDYHRALTVETRDEIEQLAASVRKMAVSLEEAQARLVGWNAELQAEVGRKVAEVESLLEAKHLVELQLRHADRLASLGTLSASLAHEIGNPLASIKTVAQVNLRSSEVTEPARGVIQAILGEVDRLARILERTTGFVRPAPEQQVVVAPAEIYRRVALLLDREARKKGVALGLAGDAAEKPVVVDGQKLEQVLFNLMANALQALDGPGSVSIVVTARGSTLEIVVEDTGPGIPEALRGRVFDPFVTTKKDGTGLGLAIVRQLVHEMKGDVRLEFPESGGTRVRIDLPVGDPGLAEEKGSKPQ
jgi:signal transduction histidine kinase